MLGKIRTTICIALMTFLPSSLCADSSRVMDLNVKDLGLGVLAVSSSGERVLYERDDQLWFCETASKTHHKWTYAGTDAGVLASVLIRPECAVFVGESKVDAIVSFGTKRLVRLELSTNRVTSWMPFGWAVHRMVFDDGRLIVGGTPRDEPRDFVERFATTVAIRRLEDLPQGRDAVALLRRYNVFGMVEQRSIRYEWRAMITPSDEPIVETGCALDLSLSPSRRLLAVATTGGDCVHVPQPNAAAKTNEEDNRFNWYGVRRTPVAMGDIGSEHALIRVWDFATSKSVYAVQNEGRRGTAARSVAFVSVDLLAYVADHYRVWFCHLKEDEPREVYRDRADSIIAMWWCEPLERLVLLQPSCVVEIQKDGRTEPPRELRLCLDQVNFARSTDGRYVSAVTKDGELVLLDIVALCSAASKP